jgi:hypothetical protein
VKIDAMQRVKTLCASAQTQPLQAPARGVSAAL